MLSSTVETLNSDARRPTAVYFLRGEPGKFTEIIQAQTDITPRLSGELQDSNGTTTKGGQRVASRIRDSILWWKDFEHSATHNACCSVKARDIVGGGFTVKELDGGAKLPEMLVSEISGMVNESTEDLIDACRDWEATGWMGLECQPTRSGRELVRLNQIDSWTLWPRVDMRGYIHARDQRWTEFVPLGQFDPQRNQLAWLNNNRWFRNTYYGVPDVLSVLLQIETAWQALLFNRDFFARRGGYRWMLLLSDGPGGYDMAGMGATSDAALIKQINYTTGQAGKDSDADLVSIPIGNRTAELHRLDADVKDMDFSALLERYQKDVLMAHGVPPLKAGIVVTGRLGGNVGQEELATYRDNVVTPKQRRWGRLLAKIIRVWYGVDVCFEFNAVEVDEFALLGPVVAALFLANVIDRDEARRRLGEPPVEEDAGRPRWGYEFAQSSALGPDATAALQYLRGEAQP